MLNNLIDLKFQGKNLSYFLGALPHKLGNHRGGLRELNSHVNLE